MTKQKTNIKHRWVYQGSSVRLDQLLAKKFAPISRAYLQVLIEDGKVRINKAFGKKGTMVHASDVIEVEAFVHPDDRMISAPEKPCLNIVHESAHYVVIDKLPDMPTHPNDFLDRRCVANHFIGLYPDVKTVGEDALRPGVVHRLDTNTSGLLILAKSQEGYLAFRALFDRREMHKTYHALTLGQVYPERLIIDTPLAHHHKNPRKMVAVVDDQVPFRSKVRSAKTMVQVQRLFQDYTLLEVKTLTGRMHQVRVHLASIGHPLVGDRLYQNQKQKSQDHGKLNRHFLHACELCFVDPWTDVEVRIQSDLPDDLQSCIVGIE